MQIIVIDSRDTFLSELQIRVMLDDRDITFSELLSSSKDIRHILSQSIPDAVVVAENVLDQQEDWLFPGCTVIGYRTKKDGENPFLQRKIPAYPYTSSAQILLDRIEEGFPTLDGTASVQPVQKSEHQTQYSSSVPTVDAETSVPKQIKTETRQETPFSQQEPITTNAPANTVRNVLENTARERQEKNAAEINRTVTPPKRKTKVVTVYSAKGGVGKTTISTELAVYLSRISIGRGVLRVCIVDCNIDFGDVLMTLKYNPEGPNLSFWAAEVRERRENGESDDEIIYSREEIERKLQVHPETGLYALIAPITHEDSMDIEPEDMSIILDNIINNGEFDFVICDTGNNTRDASVHALFKADEVLLVGAQDVNAASCNVAFLNTMQKIKFDTGKIKLVINKVLPYKMTEIAVEELEQMFAYPCLARIKHSTDVVRANNCSEPIVLTDSNHNMTKEIRHIAAYLLGQEPVSEPKKSFFSKLFKKKG